MTQTAVPADPRTFKTAGELLPGMTIIERDRRGHVTRRIPVGTVERCPQDVSNIHVNGTACYFELAQIEVR